MQFGRRHFELQTREQHADVQQFGGGKIIAGILVRVEVVQTAECWRLGLLRINTTTAAGEYG